MKKTLALLLAALLLSLLTACASEPAPAPPATSDTPATSDDPVEKPEDAPDSETAEEPADETGDEPADAPAEPVVTEGANANAGRSPNEQRPLRTNAPPPEEAHSCAGANSAKTASGVNSHEACLPAALFIP